MVVDGILYSEKKIKEKRGEKDALYTIHPYNLYHQ